MNVRRRKEVELLACNLKGRRCIYDTSVTSIQIVHSHYILTSVLFKIPNVLVGGVHNCIIHQFHNLAYSGFILSFV